MNLTRFKKDQKVIHTLYGECTVDEIQQPSKDGSFKGGWTLIVGNQQGIEQFAKDREGFLPRCFEDDMNKLTEIK